MAAAIARGTSDACIVARPLSLEHCRDTIESALRLLSRQPSNNANDSGRGTSLRGGVSSPSPTLPAAIRSPLATSSRRSSPAIWSRRALCSDQVSGIAPSGTLRGAWLDPSLPAVLPKDAGLQKGGLTRVTVDVPPGVAARPDTLGAGLVVPAAITPAFLVGMRQPTIQLDGDLVLLVVGIPVNGFAVDDHVELMPRRRKAMGTLDVAQVPVFQHRMDPIARRRQDIAKLRPPAHFLAHRHRRPELSLGGQPPAASPGNPAARIIKRPGHLNKIKHRLLNCRPWRLAISLRSLSNTAREADSDAADLDAPSRGHSNEDHFRRRVDELVQFSCCLMTEHRALTCAQYRCPQPGIPARRPTENCIDTTVNLLPAPAFKTLGNQLAV
jgi:hypothetical protein